MILRLLGQPTTPRLPLIHGLEVIADSLTHLSIYQCPCLQLRDILDTCPNLVFLQTENVDAVMPLSSSSIYPKMRHLSLCDQSERSRSHGNMVDVLSRFPSLRVLEIAPVFYSSLLPILHKHCPLYDTRSVSSDDIDNHPNPNGVTLAYLGVDEEGEVYMQDHLIAFLYLHSESLEKMEFIGNIDAENSYWRLEKGQVVVQAHDQDVQPPTPPLRYGSDPILSTNSFKRLTSITFLGPEPAVSHEYMLWLISNAPNLKAISLNKSYFRPDVANAMIDARHLSKLEIFQSWENGGDEGMKRLLEYHTATMGDRSTLEGVIIHMIHMDMHASPWLPLLSRLKCLKNLKLFARTISAENGIPIMTEIGQGCPALKDLTLGGRVGSKLADGLFKPLYKHPNIECLRIGAKSLSNDNLMDLCAFKNLKRLQLQRHIIVADDMIEMLRDHIPKVELVDDI